MKKGVFFSLSMVMLIGILFILFHNRADVYEEQQEFRIKRAQLSVMNHFVTDFEEYYVATRFRGCYGQFR